jgi:hypothetical protein
MIFSPESCTVLSGEFGDITILFHNLQVAFYPSFWLILNSPVLIFTLLYDEIHSKWMNWRGMKEY